MVLAAQPFVQPLAYVLLPMLALRVLDWAFLFSLALDEPVMALDTLSGNCIYFFSSSSIPKIFLVDSAEYRLYFL